MSPPAPPGRVHWPDTAGDPPPEPEVHPDPTPTGRRALPWLLVAVTVAVGTAPVAWVALVVARAQPTTLAAYGSAELDLTAERPDCHLSWVALAGIGGVESAHGGVADRVIGVALDGDGDLRDAGPWSRAVLAYNRSTTYLRKVTDLGTGYAARSRAG